jgi:hypothetical protein
MDTERLMACIKNVVSELEVMGVIEVPSEGKTGSIVLTKGEYGISQLHVSAKMQINMFLATSGMHAFDVELKGYESESAMITDRSMIFNTDAVVLSETGLRIVSPHSVYDRRNLQTGLGLLERMIELQTDKLVKLREYSDNNLDNWFVRAGVVSEMSVELDMVEQGYNIIGDTLETSVGDCVLCQDNDKTLVNLVCGHGFCCECLGNHFCLSSSGSATKCPLCRGPAKVLHRY